MKNISEVIYSEYTLNKFKQYLLKNIDRIDINYDVIYLYKKDIDEFERIKYNKQLIDYILNDSINFYQIEKNVIININMIEYASIDAIATGPCDVDFFNWCLEVSMPSEEIRLIYDGSKESYNFLKNIRKKIYTDKKLTTMEYFLRIIGILILIFVITYLILKIAH